MHVCLLAFYSIIITYIPCYVMCDGCWMMWMVDGVLAMRHSHEVYGLIHDGSGESRVGGSDVRSSRDTSLPST